MSNAEVVKSGMAESSADGMLTAFVDAIDTTAVRGSVQIRTDEKMLDDFLAKKRRDLWRYMVGRGINPQFETFHPENFNPIDWTYIQKTLKGNAMIGLYEPRAPSISSVSLVGRKRKAPEGVPNITE